MKKCPLILLFLLLTGPAWAQLQKGSKMVGGSIGIATGKTKFDFATDSFTEVTFRPSLGLFVNDNIALGLGLGYSWARSDRDENSDPSLNRTTFNLFSVMPFVRKYKGISDKIALYAQANVEASFGNDKGEAAGSSSKTDRFVAGININPGIAFFLSEKWSLDLGLGSIGYQYERTEFPGNDKITDNDFNFDFGLDNVDIGLRYFF